ncbi:hypothetical protein BKA70DRAFT_1410114 [Coprinopsis sp. MPI-PUGE-AT-0042]|nr:hypothetical protein BKA70DRAFT_1410114 [Coprinopsis sp. MPI-PUGE-AT-0042]
MPKVPLWWIVGCHNAGPPIAIWPLHCNPLSHIVTTLALLQGHRRHFDPGLQAQFNYAILSCTNTSQWHEGSGDVIFNIDSSPSYTSDLLNIQNETPTTNLISGRMSTTIFGPLSNVEHCDDSWVSATN